MKKEPIIETFYGSLGRVDLQENVVVLRFYPFAFSVDVPKTPVLQVSFCQPDFDVEEVRGLIGLEVEIEATALSAEIDDVFGGLTLTLPARAIVTERLPYDLKDYQEAIARSDARYASLDEALSRCHRKIEKVQSVATELLRRAEIKAESSENLKIRQAAAIDVLKRIIVELE